MQGTALIVDDEPDIRDLLGLLLRQAGLESMKAASMAGAREAIARHRFDVVFIDINLPDGLGHELIPEIRAAMPAARCITISADDSRSASALAFGADAFVAKPFSRSHILHSMGLPNGPAQ
ncbi:MAG: response regulator [Flavobacteriales bacterium]|jgi:DNA-binding response OmpR family regulator|nr:response regulator [Flavobacteriales bacterium]